MASSPSRPTFGLVLVRCAIGLVFLWHGWAWVSEKSFTGSDVVEHVRASAERHSGFVTWWGETVLLYNPDAIAFLWSWAALVFGVLITLGALTRPAGALAALFCCHGLLYGPSDQDVAFLLLLVGALASAASGAGRRFGLDTAFDQNFPSWITWRRRSSSIFP